MDISYFSFDWVHLLGFASLFLLAIVLLRNQQNGKNRFSPGPRALPIIGHLHLLTDKAKPIHQIISSLSAIYGPIMQLKFGSKPVLVISSSELAKECYTDNDRAFASRPQLAQGKHLGYDFCMLGWASYGPYWRNVRKISVLELLSSKRIQSFQAMRTREISKTLNSLFKHDCTKVVNMREVLFQLVFNLLMGMIIGDQYSEEKYGMSYAEAKHLIEEAFVLHKAVCIGDYIPLLKWFDLQGYEKAMKTVQQKLDSFLQRIVQKHRERNNGSKEEEDMDFIDVLISKENDVAISNKDDFIKSTAMAMLAAGTDTSSVTLECALSLVLCHTHTLNKAQEELDSKIGLNRVVEESDIPQLKYLQAIVKETMRLYPAAPLLVPHESIKECTVGGFHIPAGTTIFINAWAIQREARVWDKPLQFIPERFMEREKEIEIENIHMTRGNEFEMLPFGAGRRGCPGAALAMNTVHITLARLLQGFNWFVPDGQEIDMNEGVGTIIPRAAPLEVTIKPRLAHYLYQNFA